MATIDLGKIKFNWRGTYVGGTAYVPDDVVYYMDGSVGSSYMCVANTTGNAPSSGGTPHASWQYLAKGQATSPTTTQGDLIVRGASADERLAIGAAGKVLKVNSSANGFEFGTGGGVVQTKQTAITTAKSVNGIAAYADIASYIVSITPTSASNKILVMVNMQVSTDGEVIFQLIRTAGGSATIIGQSTAGSVDSFTGQFSNSARSGYYDFQSKVFIFLDDAQDTNAHTYKVQWKNISNVTTYLNRTAYSTSTANYAYSGTSTITTMEVLP